MQKRIHNFSAGPSALPLEVLEKAQKELLNFNSSGMSIMEMSHRSKIFGEVLARAEAGVRENLNVPDDYAVLFLQGGASLQFVMAPMNLVIENKPAELINTGIWTKKALKEIKKICACDLLYDGSKENFLKLPDIDALAYKPGASFVYMASNNTIYGTQFKRFPDTKDVPLVCDMSSDIFSRPVDIKNFGVIFAGAQKNIGPAGLALVIIRKDLAERVNDQVPTILQYKTHIENNSLFNTPPTFGIYMVALVMDWIRERGGVAALEKINAEKAGLLYTAVEKSSMYECPISEADRSAMNVVFRFREKADTLEKLFVEEAEAKGLCNLKGHRSIGGLRASIYNAVSATAVEALVKFMNEFEKKHG